MVKTSQILEDRRRMRIRLLWLTAAFLMVALAFYWYRNPETFALFTGELSVATQPEGAEIYLDGKLMGITPLTLGRVAEGSKVLRLVHRFHEDLVETIEIESGGHLQLERTLPAATGGLWIVSNPTDGEIELDGERLDETTPLTLPDLNTGTHEVTVSYPNHRSVTQSVEVLPGKTTKVVMDMILVPWGRLTINSVPPGAQITLVGLDQKYQPGMELPLGEYAIEVAKKGYPAVATRIRVGLGDNRQTITLQRLQVPLRVNVTPSNARVTLEYELEGLQRVRPYGSDIKVPTGTVTLVARAPGYRTERRRVNVGSDGLTLNMVLEKFQVTPGEKFQDRLRSGGMGPELVVIPAGSYQMGDATGAGAADERPRHGVVLTQPLAVGVYEVTVADYARYRASQQQSAVTQAPENPEHPAVDVSPGQVREYLRWLSDETGYQYRLPSEAEWEYFARAGATGDFVGGVGEDELCDFANIADQSTKKLFRQWEVAQCTDGFAKIAPVGQLRPNAFGLHDVSGNVSEWVADCWSRNYEDARSDEVPYLAAESCQRVFRGGSWDSQPQTVRLSYRESSDRANNDRGFRVAREL